VRDRKLVASSGTNGNHHSNHSEENHGSKSLTRVFAEPPFFWNMWRVLTLSAAIPWVCFTLYLLLQTEDGARQATHYFNKGIKPYDENYALDCGFDSFTDKVFDVFTISHAVGWFISGFAFRSFEFTLLFTVIDELCEVWWRCCYPNFMECWWDHILLDLVFTNALGAFLGTKVVNWWLNRPFDWGEAFKSDKRGRWYLWTTCIVVKVVSLFGLFGFKWVLWIPSAHWINIVHMWVHVVCFFPCIAEAYYNLKNGTRSWGWSCVMWTVYGLDALLSIKLGYASPLFDKWDIWGKLVAVFFGALLFPGLATYLL